MTDSTVDRRRRRADTRPDLDRHVAIACFGTACTIGLAFAFVGLETHSFWYDELFTARLLEPANGTTLLSRIATDVHPPLYLLAQMMGQRLQRHVVGIGDAALADGARMVHVLQPMEPEKWIEETGSPLNDGEQGIRLSRPKQSYTPRDQSFDLFIVRDGYSFHEVPAKQKPRSNQAAVLAANAEDDRAALRVIIADHAAGKFTSKAYLENALGDRSTGVELSRSRIRFALARLERDGKVEVRHRVPKQAGSNAFLAPTSGAFFGGDHS